MQSRLSKVTRLAMEFMNHEGKGWFDLDEKGRQTLVTSLAAALYRAGLILEEENEF